MRRLAENALPPISHPYLAFISPISPPTSHPHLAHISPTSPQYLPKVLRLAEDALPPETRPPVAGYLPLSARALGGRYPATGARRAPLLAVDEEVDELLGDVGRYREIFRDEGRPSSTMR